MFEHMTCLTGFKVLNVRQTLTHCWNAQPIEGLCLWSLAAEQLQVTDCGWPQKPGSGCVRCVGVLRQRWVILIPMYATSPPLSNSSSTISSCNVLTNMHFGLSHLEPPQDVHWSWLVLAVLFDWSPCVCVCVWGPSPCCRQAGRYSEGWRGLLWGHTLPHTHAASPRGILRSAVVFPVFFFCFFFAKKREDCTRRGIAETWRRSLRGGRRAGGHWHRYEGRKSLAEEVASEGESLFKTDCCLYDASRNTCGSSEKHKQFANKTTWVINPVTCPFKTEFLLWSQQRWNYFT